MILQIETKSYKTQGNNIKLAGTLLYKFEISENSPYKNIPSGLGYLSLGFHFLEKLKVNDGNIVTCHTAQK